MCCCINGSHPRRLEYFKIFYCMQSFSYVISTRHSVGLYCIPGHAGVRRNEITNKFARDSSVQKFVGPELSLGVSRQNTRKIQCWVDNQHLAMWGVPRDRLIN